MGLLLDFDSYTKCVLILYKLFLQCFYKNMHLPIVLCCDMKIHCLQKKLITTKGCDCIPIPSVMCVSVPFLKLHEHACPYCFSCWYKGLFTNKLWQCCSLLYQDSCVSIVYQMTLMLYSTLALSHFPFFFDVVCTQVHCLPINNNYESNIFEKYCQNIAIDVIRLYSCIKCGEC